MNDSTSKRCGNFRLFHPMVLLGLLALLPACGGGGGDVAPDTPPTKLDYVFGPPRGPFPRLTVTGPQSKFILTSIPPASDGPYMAGTFDSKTLDTTIADNAAVPILWPDTTTPTGDPLFGNVSVTVNQAFRWNGADDPTAGEFLITSRNGIFPGTIRARVLAGGAGVRAEYDSNNDGAIDNAVSEVWGSFHDLWADGTKPLFQRVASFVFYTREATFSMIELSMETTNVIEDHRAELQAAGSDNAIAVACDALPGTPNQPGSFSIVWTDVNGNGQIDYDTSPAQQNDTFTFTINQCWTDDPSDPDDLLLDGVIRLVYYEPHLQWGTVFDNLVVTPTLNNVVIPGSATTVNGGFSLFVPGF